MQQMQGGNHIKEFLIFMIICMIQMNGVFAISTTFSGFLSDTSPAFAQYNAGLPYKYFQAYRLAPSTSGYYTIVSNSSLDPYGYLYNTAFDPARLNLNLIVEDDDSGGSNQFRMNQYLSSSTTYILVVTTFNQRIAGVFSINIDGPASMSYSIFTPVLPSTIVPTSTATSSNQTFTFSGTLTTTSALFPSPNTPSASSYFQAYRVVVYTSGVYTFRSDSTMDTYGYLYADVFYSSSPTTNLIASDDDGAGNSQFLLRINLNIDRVYFLIVTTYQPRITGSFTVRGSGPSTPSVTTYTPPSGLSTSTGTSGSMTSTYSGYLSNSQRFARPSGSGSYYYYQALRIQVYATGTYSMASSSSMDTYGCLYSGDFDPSYPTLNSVICNDDGAGSNQFLITSNFVSGRYYTLVVTTFSENTVGSYMARITGPSQVGINSYIPSTARPIQTSTSYWDYDFDSYTKLSTTAIIAVVCSIVFFIIIIISAIAAAAAKRNRRFVVQTGVTAAARPPTVYRPNQQQVAYVGSPPSRAPVHVMEEQPPSYTELNFNEQKY